METKTDMNKASEPDAIRSPKIRQLLRRKPTGLYLCGYLAILFCAGVLLWVAALLGWM